MSNLIVDQARDNQLDLDKTAIVQAARMLGDTWFLLIIRELLDGKKRYGEIQEGLEKVSPQTLSGRLKLLEQLGFVTRHAYAEIPPRVEYALTDKGFAVSDVLRALSEFGKQYFQEMSSTEEDDCPPH